MKSVDTTNYINTIIDLFVYNSNRKNRIKP